MHIVPLTVPAPRGQRDTCPGRCSRFRELQALMDAGLATWAEKQELRELEREAVRREARRGR